MTTSCKGYARISISLNEIHESGLKPHLFDDKVYDNDMIEDTTPSVINTGTRQLKPDELYKVMSSFSTSKGETSLLRTHDFRETSSLAVNGYTVVCDKRQLTETDQLLDSEDEVSNITKRMSEESSQHKMLDFPNLTEQEIREKLQDDDVIEQFHVIDSLSQIDNSNLSMLEHVNKTNPAIRRITMKTRLTAREVKDVCIDEDIAVIVNEFLQTNWTGNHIVGRVLREHYSTLYSWLTVLLQVERNAWASRLKQALEKMNKQRRDSLEMNEFIVKSVNRIQHLIKSCTLAMLEESVEVSENKTCLLSSTTDTSTQEREFSRTNGFNTHLKIISNNSQVAHEAAGRSTLCSNEQRHQTHKQLFKKTTSSLDMSNYKSGNNNHSSSTRFDKPNHSSSTSFDNKPNHSSNTSFDNKPNHSSKTHFDNKRKHSSSPSFDNKPKHSSSTSFDQVNLSTISTLRNDSDVFPLSGHTYRQIINRDISRNELCSNNCCVTNTELNNEDDTTCIFNNTGHKTLINTTTLSTSDQDEFNAYNHDMDYRSSLCESIDDLTNVCGKLINILTTSLQHRPLSCGISPVRFPAVSTCMQDTHTHSYIKREDLEKHLQTLETDNIHILNEMTTLRNFLNEKSEEIMYLQHQIITLRNSLTEKSEEIMKLQYQIITLRNSLTEKSEEIMKLQNQIQTLETILKDSTRSKVPRYLSTDFTLLNNHKINMTNNYLLNGVHGSNEIPLENSKKIQMLRHRNKLTENIDVSNSVMAQGVTSLTEHTLETKQKNHSHMNTRVMLTEEDNISTCQLTSIEKIKKRFKFRASKSVMEAAILKHTSKKETRDQCNFEIIVKAVPKVSSNKSKNVRLQNITTSPVLRCSSNSFSGSINSNAITRYSRNDMKPSLKVLESAIYIEGDISNECQYLDQSNLLAESPATETSISCRGYSSVNDDRVVNTRAIKQTKESLQLCNKSGNNKNNVKHTECIANNSNEHINARNVVEKNVYQSHVGSLVSKPMKREYSHVKYQLLQSNMGTIVSKSLQTKSEHMMQRLDRKMVVSKCLRCQQLFTFMDNHKLACSYHKDTVTSLEQHDHCGQVIKVTRQWACCLQPESASGCCHGKHI